MENILLPPDDPRRVSLLKRRNQLEGQLDIIALSSRQMHIICPLEILRVLLRTGSVNFFELRADLVAKYDYRRKSFSEARYTEAFMKIASEIGIPEAVKDASPPPVIA